ncbi:MULTISPECIES: TonB-dependent receptor [Brevundimonas]|uniref:TonB-dependent receptor n=1 Tax=Brevundimonas TaxID=41275 RepID=UPI0018F737CA|nr:TonB-dependent receptor [Brevundimonas sp. LPMIX5]
MPTNWSSPHQNGEAASTSVNVFDRRTEGKAVEKTHKFMLLTACSVAAISAWSSAAMAQSEEAEGQRAAQVSDVVVTATRREASTKDTPVAVVALTGAAISETQAFSMDAVTRLNPSVQTNNRGIGDNQIIIRGVSSSGKPTVGLYFDETVMTGIGLDGGSDNQPNIQLHDIARVEILKGPQGTLFGASSMSGTMRIVTNKPDPSGFAAGFSASAATVSDGNPFYQGDGYLNLPLVEDKLAIRAVGWADSGGGYIDRVGPLEAENVNDQRVTGGRIMALARPNDRITLTGTLLRQKQEADGSQYFENDLGPYRTSAPTQENFEDTTDVYSAVADIFLDHGTLTASTSLLKRDMAFLRDSTPTARRFGIPGVLAYSQGQELSNLSTELRYASDLDGPLQYVIGGFYSKQESDTYSMAVLADPATGLPPCVTVMECRANGFATSDINSARTVSTVDQYALFTELTYQATDKLNLTGGIRYYNADIGEFKSVSQALRFPTSPVQTVDRIALDQSSREDNISYNFAMSYAITPDTTAYARIASGFRPGGVNDAEGAAQYGVTVPAAYTSDDLWNYEVGVKSYLADRRYYVELAAYHIDWSNQQVSVTDPGGTFAFIANAGKSAVDGVEAQITARPFEGLFINLGATYTNARLTADLPSTAETAGEKGDRIPYSPKISYAGQISYEAPLGADATWRIGANFNYRGSAYTSFNDQDPNMARLDDYFLLNLSGGVTYKGWTGGVFVENVADAVPEIGLRVTGDGFRVYTTRPRTVGLRLSREF